MKLKTKAKTILGILKFVSNDECRHYLTGVRVSPAPGGGVMIAATNGHYLGLYIDKEGYCDGTYVLPISKKLASGLASKHTTNTALDFYIFDGRAYVSTMGLSLEEAGKVLCKPTIMRQRKVFVRRHKKTDIAIYKTKTEKVPNPYVLHTDYITPLDVSYPEIHRVFPKFEDIMEADKAAVLSFNGAFPRVFSDAIGLFKQGKGMGESKGGECLSLYSSGFDASDGATTGPIVIRNQSVPEFTGLLMPMRSGCGGRDKAYTPAVREWLDSLDPAKVKAKEEAALKAAQREKKNAAARARRAAKGTKPKTAGQIASEKRLANAAKRLAAAKARWPKGSKSGDKPAQKPVSKSKRGLSK